MMLITKKNMITGVPHTMELDVTPQQIKAWENGMFIQDAMPNLSPDEREFILTGMTAEDWNALFAEEEEVA